MPDSKIAWLQQLGVQTLPTGTATPDDAPGGAPGSPPDDNQSTPADGGQSIQPADDGGQSVQPPAASQQPAPANRPSQSTQPQAAEPNQSTPDDGGQSLPAEDDGQSVQPPADDPNQSTPTDGGQSLPAEDGGQSVQPPADDPNQSTPADGGQSIQPDEPNQSTQPDEDLYIINFNGKQYYGTKAEGDALRERLIAIALDGVCPPLRNQATMHAERVKSLDALNKDQYIVAFFVKLASSADFGSLTAAVAAEQSAVAALEAAIKSNPGTADGAYQAAVDAINASGKAIDAYMDALEIGAGRNVAVLQVVEVTAFGIAAACGAIVLAPAGAAATATTGAISNAGFGALQALAEEGAKGLYGDFKGDYGGAAINIGKAALLNGIGSLLGSATGTALKGKVVGIIASKFPGLTAEATKKLTAFVEGAIGNAVQSVISGLPDLAAGKTTWDQLAVLTAENMIAGGVGNVIAPGMPLKH